VKPEDAWRGLQQVNEWIRFADAKAGAVLAGSGVLGAFLVHAIPRLSDFRDQPVRAVLLSLAVCSVGLSALITLGVLAPRLRTGEARSLLYFDHVARRYGQDRQAFVAMYLHLGEDEAALCNQLIEQMWANSLVARRKFRRVAIATYALGTAMFAAGAAVVIERL
jgi:Family of unknown function (DUF5706)